MKMQQHRKWRQPQRLGRAGAIALLMWATVLGTALAREYFVAPSGADDATGTRAQPLRRFRKRPT